MFAALNDRRAVVDYLLDTGVDVDARPYRNTTALHFAIQFRRHDMVRHLLDEAHRQQSKTTPTSPTPPDGPRPATTAAKQQSRSANSSAPPSREERSDPVDPPTSSIVASATSTKSRRGAGLHARASRRGNGSSVVLLSGVVCRGGRWFCGRLEVRASGLCECLHDRRVPGFEVVDHAVAYVVADHAAQNGVVFDVAEVAEAGDEGVH